ncbi:MAG TPA: thiamine pyrophosphate-binding protein, partial [Acidimicrobiales bacterium]|nr:thiamine pyrophosphate-binding protein [Acidimicrobiales bacterium]
SSSMPVRDVEWFAPAMAGQQVLSNRGANGIDGVLSTAIGAALAEPTRPAVALIGDLAFTYDAGALLWAAARPIRLSVVVVDNDGGGIFSFLPQATALEPDRFERYWGTPHGIDLVALATAYGVAARRVTSRSELDAFLDAESLSEPGVRVAVVPSHRAANVAVHDRLYEAVAAAVGAPAP